MPVEHLLDPRHCLAVGVWKEDGTLSGNKLLQKLTIVVLKYYLDT